MSNTRRKYEAIVSFLRLRRALHTATPNETSQDLHPGDEVLVHREEKGWQGPYNCIYRDGHLSIVLD